MESFDAETTPLVNLLNDLLTEYTTQLHALLGQFDTDGNRNTSAAATQSRHATADQLVRLDGNLQQLFGELQQHQRRQQEIRRVQQLAMRSGAAKLQFIERMLGAQSELQTLVSDADSRLARARVAENATPAVDEIIQYANKLSKFTAAPPNYDPEAGMPAEPPYPVLVAMRAGALNRYRMHKAARNSAEDEDEEPAFAHAAADDQFDDVDDDDLFLGLDLNPDLE
ncbi:hypothetical protein IWW50_002344 [Coemansia erecta]|nr:hypothetical protein GGF43_002029 [Coemansia sp. RSA 2618]KAJ2826463.1 hypothetical protein IWW50_002344 [Coemansia erecta]